MAERGQIKLWIAAAKQGDRWALAKLLVACDPYFRARAETRMEAARKGKRDLDDVLQGVYLQVVRKISTFRGREPAAFLNWVYVILDHELVDAVRAVEGRARDGRPEVRAGAAVVDGSYWNLLDQLYADSGTPSRVVRREEAVSALFACLADLSEPQRQVIQLRYLEGLSVEEVAARLDKSPAAVAALSKRARETLRSAMDRLGEFTHGS